MPERESVVAQQTVRDVMNSNPVTVTTRTSSKDLVGLMIGKDLSAVLVLGRHGEIVGLVTETNLLMKQGLQPGPRDQGRHYPGASCRKLHREPG
jgi:CBS-domain-containing membrane protein